MYDTLGHAVTGQIRDVGKRCALKMFTKAPLNVVAGMCQLVSGDVPPEDIIERCDQFHWMLFSSKATHATDATERSLGKYLQTKEWTSYHQHVLHSKCAH